MKLSLLRAGVALLCCGAGSSVSTAATLTEVLDGPGITAASSSGDVQWFGEEVPANARDGVDAARSGAIAGNQISQFSTTVTGPGVLRFWWKISSERTYDVGWWRLNGGPRPPVSGESGWQEITSVLTAGSHTVEFFYRKDATVSAGADALWVDQLRVEPPAAVTLAQALDLNSPRISISNIGGNVWTGGAAPMVTHDGVDAARSGGSSGLSSLLLDVTGPGIFSAWVALDPQLRSSNNPLLTMTAARRLFGWNDTAPWSRVEVEIPHGPQQVRWRWEDNSTPLQPEGAGYVDQVVFTAANTTTLAEALDGAGLTWTTDLYREWGGLLAPMSNHDGVDAARSAGANQSGPTGLETTVSGPGVVTFWWRTDGLSGEWSAFLVDGNEVRRTQIPLGAPWMGTWWQESVNVTGAGIHTLRWEYNNPLNGGGLWLDEVTWTPGGYASVSVDDAVGAPALFGPQPVPGWQGWQGPGLGRDGSAAKSENTASAAATLRATVSGPGTVSWWWRSDSTTRVVVNLDSVTRLTEDLTKAWTRVECSVPAGSHTLDWRHNANGAAYVDEVVFTPSAAAEGLPEAVDAPALVWRSGGAGGPWFRQTVESHDGSDAARAPVTPDGGISWIKADVAGPGMLRFAWKVSCEARASWLPFATGDQLSFSLSGQQSLLTPIEGESGWTTHEVPVNGTGLQTARWSYIKNGTVSAGQDTAWLDGVTFTPAGPVDPGEAVDAPGLTWTTGGSGEWTGLAGAGDAQQGMDYARSTPTAAAGISWLEAALPDGGHVTYYCRYTGSAGSLRVLLNGQIIATIPPNALSSSWLKLEAGAPSGQAQVLRFECDSSSGSWHLDAVSVSAGAVSLGEALEAQALPWSQSGPGGWSGVAAATAHDGQDAAQADARSGTLETSIPGPSALSFWWRREGSVSNYASRANGRAIALHQTSGAWERVQTELPGPGPQVVTWGVESGFSGTVSLDEVSLTPLAAIPLADALDGSGLTWTTNPSAPWSGWQMANTSRDGEDAAAGATAVVANPSWIEAQWIGAGALTFQTRMGAPGLRQDTLRVALDGGDSMPLNATNWLREFALVNGGGPHAARWTVSTGVNSSVAAGGLLDEVSFHPALPLGDALDAPEFTWTTGGSGAWIGLPDAVAGAHSGGDAAMSHAGPNQQTWLETTVTGPGMLEFRQQVNSGIDELAFSVDGVQQWSATSIYSWQPRTLVIPAGAHTVRWTHTYGAGGAELRTRAMLDAVTFTPAASSDPVEALDVAGLVLRTGGTGGWLNQDELAHDGTDALQSAYIGNGAESWIEFDASEAQFITFQLAALALPANASQTYTAAVRLTLDGTRQFSDFVPADGRWKKITVRAPGAGAHTLRISLLPAVGDTTQFSLLVDALVIEPLVNVPLADALEWPAFTTSATAPWQGFTAAAAGFDGVDFAAPGSLDFTGTAWLETTITGPGRLRYRQRITPGGNYQAIGFTRYLRVNGAAQTPTGESIAVDLSAGNNTLRWEYNRTGSVSLQAPDWHLDQISFTPGTTLAEALDRPAQSWSSSSGWGGLVSVADSRDGVDTANVEDIAADTDSRVESAFPGPGKLMFFMRRAGSVPATLRMYISGQEVPWTLEPAEVSGWERGSLLLSGPQQTVRWNFRKPSGTPPGSGGVFLDQVTLLAPMSITLPEALDAESLAWITGPNAWEGFAGDGPDWAVSADVAPGERSWVETTVNGPGFFSYRAGLTGDATNPGTLKAWLPSVMDGGEEVTVRGSVGWAENQRIIVTGSGAQPVRWTYRDRDATFGNTDSAANLDAITFTPAVPLARVLDAPGLTWTTSPAHPWIGINDAQTWPAFPLHTVSGPSGAHVPSWIETNVTGPASLRFDWMTSGSNATDATLWVDDKLLQVLSDNGTWRLVLPAGVHSVRWQRRLGAPDITGGARLANVALLPWPGDLVDMPGAPWLLSEAGWSLLTTGAHDGVDGLSLAGNGARLAGRVFGPGIFTSWQHEGTAAWAQYTETLTSNGALNIRRYSGNAGAEWRHDEFVFQPAPSVTLAEALDAPGLPWITDGAALWQGFGAPIQASEGGDAAAAGIIGNGEESWLETSVSGPGRLTFLYTASPSLTWSVDGIPSSLPQHGSANAQGFSTASVQLPSGVHVIRWTQQCPAGQEESTPVSLDRVVFNSDTTADDLAVALDATAFPWTVSGITTWRGQSEVSHDGTDAAAATQYTGQILQTTVAGPGTVSFWWRRDKPITDNLSLTFQSNSEALVTATPNAGWERMERILSGSGPQILQWKLSAGGGPYGAGDTAWIDQFSFTPAPAVSLPEALDAPAFSWQTNPSAPWTGVAGAAFSGDGSDAAGAGAPSPGNDSWLETQVEGPGTISFLWRRNSGTEPLLCEIDGQLRGSATNLDFKPASFDFLTGGTHTIRWRLRRTADTDPAAAAAVDAFEFTPLPDDVTYNAFAAATLPEALRDPAADVDGDGLASLVEFAHGLDPASDDTALVPAPLGLPVIRLVTAGDGQEYCELQFPRRRHTRDLTQLAEFSSHPSGFWTISPYAPVVSPVDADWEIVTIRDSLPAAAAGHRFGRVRVVLQQPEY